MLCIHLKNNDPFYCLAAEEYLLKHFADDIFMLWQGENTVVMGKHQCAPAEINYPFVRANNITVARRISGGGTVFHDKGNVNFTFIKNVASPAEISFRKMTLPVVDSLARIGVTAVNSGRNDLLVNGYKISGNAEHIYKNRVLHHGTLLFDSDLTNLGNAIRVQEGKYQTKAVQSNRSVVANISRFLERNMNTDEFMAFMMDVQLQHKDSHMYDFNEKDAELIKKQAEDKFSTWDWNFGYSPKYEFSHTTHIVGRKLMVSLKAEKAIITEMAISGDFFSGPEASFLSNALVGKRHCYEEIRKVTANAPDEVVYAFF